MRERKTLFAREQFVKQLFDCLEIFTESMRERKTLFRSRTVYKQLLIVSRFSYRINSRAQDIIPLANSL